VGYQKINFFLTFTAAAEAQIDIFDKTPYKKKISRFLKI